MEIGGLFTDEEKACGFFDSKAQRECFAATAPKSRAESSLLELCRDEKQSLNHGFYTTLTNYTDCETGLSYFGARYYDPTLLTGWTAVDPMADKYPSLSPYNYCAWNPV